jgi:hypothetical protein
VAFAEPPKRDDSPEEKKLSIAELASRINPMALGGGNPLDRLKAQREAREAAEKTTVPSTNQEPVVNAAGDFNNTMFAAKPSIGAKRTIAKKKGFFSDSEDDDDFVPPPKKPVAQ